MSFITIEKISKSYFFTTRKVDNQGHEVLSNFSLTIEQREFITFFGPNACGKTTLLNLISGLSALDKGSIEINGRPPQQTTIGYVFQNFHLSFLPWRKNIDNIAFPLELQGIKKNERRAIVKEFLEDIEVELPLYNYPYQLSGGQQQLLAIARALISEPKILLLDEPFNQLDFQTRIVMQDKLLQIWQKTKTTILFISHELDEAIVLGDKIVLLSRRPARILEIIENNLPRPRSHEIIQTQDFFSLRNRGLSIFEKSLKS